MSSSPHPNRATYARDPAPDPAWAKHGKCASHPDPDMWFARASDDPRAQQAIAICQTCPVQAACLDYAMSVPGLAGIWAGTTKVGRTRLRDRQSRPAA